MRLHLGPIPDAFTPDSSWRPIREPGPLVMQLFAIPIGIGMALLVGYCWQWLRLSSSFHVSKGHAVFFLVGLVLSFPMLIVVHELLHAIVHPQFGRSRATILGAWPSRFLFYAHYSGPLTRNRFLAVFAMPFLIITVLPLAVGAIGVLPPVVTPAAAGFSLGTRSLPAVTTSALGLSWRSFRAPPWFRTKAGAHSGGLMTKTRPDDHGYHRAQPR